MSTRDFIKTPERWLADLHSSTASAEAGVIIQVRDGKELFRFLDLRLDVEHLHMLGWYGRLTQYTHDGRGECDIARTPNMTPHLNPEAAAHWVMQEALRWAEDKPAHRASIIRLMFLAPLPLFAPCFIDTCRPQKSPSQYFYWSQV